MHWPAVVYWLTKLFEMQMTTCGFVVGMQPAGMLVFEHLPPTHSGVLDGQTLPHVPQFALSLSRSAQKGAPPSCVQTVWPCEHCDAQPPSLQNWRLPEHAVPHAPQFALSVERFAQYAAAPPSVLHSVCAVLHALTHWPPEQNSWTPHVRPHEPQFALSVCVLVQYGAPPSGVHFVSLVEHWLLQLPA